MPVTPLTSQEAQSDGGVPCAMSACTGIHKSGQSSADGDDVTIVVTHAPPPPTGDFSFSRMFCSDLRLRRVPEHFREAGRLWVVADVLEEVATAPVFATA